MKTSSFLGKAGARADHLRELSHHIRSLQWTSASLREVDHEIPELELAMAVYRRLNAEGADTSDLGDPEAFLSIAESRTDHLRQLSHHMHSLDWVHASLTEIENEIPELELTMTVFRRLTGETDSGSRASVKSEPAPAKARAGARASREGEEADPAPSFSQFAMQNLDTTAPKPGDASTEANGSR